MHMETQIHKEVLDHYPIFAKKVPFAVSTEIDHLLFASSQLPRCQVRIREWT